MIAGSYDFFGFNGYTSRAVKAQQKSDYPNYENDRDTTEVCLMHNNKVFLPKTKLYCID